MARKTTKKQFENLKLEILELLDEVSLFDDNSEKAKKARVKRVVEDRDYDFFFQTYFPHYCEEATPKFHLDLDKEFEKEQEIIPIASFRGSAKSTRVTFGRPVHEAVIGTEGIIPIIMDTKDQAEEQVERIKIELENNPRLINDFGNLKIKGTSDSFVVENRLKIKALGSGQKPRGLKFKQHRPKLVICDDMENDEAVENPARRKKLLKWFLKALYPAIHPTEGKIVIVGTILHFDSLLQNLIDAHDGVIFKAIKDNGHSIWPERFPLEALKRIKQNIGNEAFEQEYMNNPLDEDNQDFKLDELHFYQEITEEIIGRFAYIDPALGKTKKSDYPAIIVGYVGKSKNIYIEDCLMKKVKIEKTMANIYMLQKKHDINIWGIEAFAFQEVLKNWLDKDSRQNGIYLSTKAITPSGSKETRIKSLVPLTSNGTIKFKAKKRLGGFDAEKSMRILIEQFTNYPKGNDDGPDGVHGLTRIIKKKNGKVKTTDRGSYIKQLAGIGASFRRGF